MLFEWSDFLEVRRNGLKPLWKSLLDEKLVYFESLNADDKVEYIENLCREYFDNGQKEIPIQHPRIWGEILRLWRTKLNDGDEKYLLWAYKGISFRGVYTILNIHPEEILVKILKANPNNTEAKILLFKFNFESLEYAMHELPSGLVLEETVCHSIIEKCDAMLLSMPSLNDCTARVDSDYLGSRRQFFYWLEYIDLNIKIGFYKWLKGKA